MVSPAINNTNDEGKAFLNLKDDAIEFYEQSRGSPFKSPSIHCRTKRQTVGIVRIPLTEYQIVDADTTVETAQILALLPYDLLKNARRCRNVGKCSDAINLLSQAKNIVKENLSLKIEILREVALCYTAVESPENTLTAYTKLLEIDPTNSDYLMQRGARLVALGRWQEAQETLEKAERIPPKQPLVLRLLGQCHLEAGRLEVAERYLKDALEMKKETFFYSIYLEHYTRCQELIEAASPNHELFLMSKPRG